MYIINNEKQIFKNFYLKLFIIFSFINYVKNGEQMLKNQL